MEEEYIIFETVEVTKSDNVSICIINDLSNELKDYIRNIFVNICQGDRINISFEYKSVLKDFIERIKKVYDTCDGNESYDNVVEFYDEDGVVLMTAEDLDENTIRFTFTDDEQIYDYIKTTNKNLDKVLETAEV